MAGAFTAASGMQGHGVAPRVHSRGRMFETIPAEALSSATGGEHTFHFQGTSPNSCFAQIGRGVAHGFGLTGPWKPHSAMRPGEHLLLDKQGNEAGAATWSNGNCDVGVY